jgi:hypothetical protein
VCTCLQRKSDRMTTSVMKKFDIINVLGQRFKLGSYLEICTPTTGLTFDKVSETIYPKKVRLIYRSSEISNNLEGKTFHTASHSSSDFLNLIYQMGNGSPIFDTIFIDSWHSYSASSMDLTGAWRLLRPNGFLVVHDCNPPSMEAACPDFVTGEWCGETYRAYIDFLCLRPDASFLTVDTDYGCGVVQKLASSQNSADSYLETLQTWLIWNAIGDSHAERYNFFSQNKRNLLQLRSVAEFFETFEVNANAQSESPVSTN